jgi:leucyl/phenylalanyl-tRNA--protein transferase
VNLIERTPQSVALKRDAAGSRYYTENLSATLQRWVLGVAWSLKPPRLYGVPATLFMLAKYSAGFGLKPGELPDPEKALRHPDGLAGICAEMSVPILRAAYAKGLYPHAHIGPEKWWAPKERMALFFEDFRIEKNLRRRIRQNEFRVTFDQAFAAVIRACAEPRPGWLHLTWIRPDIIEAYTSAFEAGLAHSVEVWDRAGNLAGGAYGLSVGRVFFTESQFTRQRDASKVGFTVLNCHLQRWGYLLNDGKFWSSYLNQLGFKLIPRAAFNALLAKGCDAPGRQGPWVVDASIDVSQWKPAESATPLGRELPL